MNDKINTFMKVFILSTLQLVLPYIVTKEKNFIGVDIKKPSDFSEGFYNKF